MVLTGICDSQHVFQSPIQYDILGPTRGCDGYTTSGFTSTSDANGGSTDPWWYIDLTQTISIDHIVMFNRYDGGLSERLQGYEVWMGSNNSLWNGQGNVLAAVSTATPEPAFPSESLTTYDNQGNDISAQFVWVHLPGVNRVLSFTELQLWANPVTPPTPQLLCAQITSDIIAIEVTPSPFASLTNTPATYSLYVRSVAGIDPPVQFTFTRPSNMIESDQTYFLDLPTASYTCGASATNGAGTTIIDQANSVTISVVQGGSTLKNNAPNPADSSTGSTSFSESQSAVNGSEPQSGNVNTIDSSTGAAPSIGGNSDRTPVSCIATPQNWCPAPNQYSGAFDLGLSNGLQMFTWIGSMSATDYSFANPKYMPYYIVLNYGPQIEFRYFTDLNTMQPNMSTVPFNTLVISTVYALETPIPSDSFLFYVQSNGIPAIRDLLTGVDYAVMNPLQSDTTLAYANMGPAHITRNTLLHLEADGNICVYDSTLYMASAWCSDTYIYPVDLVNWNRPLFEADYRSLPAPQGFSDFMTFSSDSQDVIWDPNQKGLVFRSNDSLLSIYDGNLINTGTQSTWSNSSALNEDSTFEWLFSFPSNVDPSTMDLVGLLTCGDGTGDNEMRREFGVDLAIFQSIANFKAFAASGTGPCNVLLDPSCLIIQLNPETPISSSNYDFINKNTNTFHIVLNMMADLQQYEIWVNGAHEKVYESFDKFVPTQCWIGPLFPSTVLHTFRVYNYSMAGQQIVQLYSDVITQKQIVYNEQNTNPKYINKLLPYSSGSLQVGTISALTQLSQDSERIFWKAMFQDQSITWDELQLNPLYFPQFLGLAQDAYLQQLVNGASVEDPITLNYFISLDSDRYNKFVLGEMNGWQERQMMIRQ